MSLSYIHLCCNKLVPLVGRREVVHVATQFPEPPEVQEAKT